MTFWLVQNLNIIALEIITFSYYQSNAKSLENFIANIWVNNKLRNN